MIEAYGFGEMVIDGKPYNKDLIIFPDGKVFHPWRRKEGHRVAVSDIDELLKSKLDVLVIGTGNPGLMKPESGLLSRAETLGIKLAVSPTKDAVSKYNKLAKTRKEVGACFHLTC